MEWKKHKYQRTDSHLCGLKWMKWPMYGGVYKHYAHTHTHTLFQSISATTVLTLNRVNRVASYRSCVGNHTYTCANAWSMARRKKNNKNNNKSQNLIQKNRHIHTERNKEVLRCASFDSCVLFSSFSFFISGFES